MIFNEDIVDLIKVNLPCWGIVSVTKSGMIDTADIIQAWGTNALIFITLIYTTMKLIKLGREMIWDKVDRKEDKQERKEDRKEQKANRLK